MGAPIGNKNAENGKRWKNALIRRMEALQAIDKIADSLITEAMTGNIQAIKEIGDRLDGKPKQQIDLGGQEDNPIVSEIQVKLVKANDTRS